MPIRNKPTLDIGVVRRKAKKGPKKSVTLYLPEPHPRQATLINAFEEQPGVRFVVGACGTKFGKTFGCCTRLVREAWENKGSLNWWVAPFFAQAKMAYYMVKKMLPRGSYEEFKADLRLVLIEPDGSERSVIEFKSADNDNSLRGFAVDFFVLDEAARVSYESFKSVLTTVTQTNGRGIIISTPNGQGWFYEVYQWGEKCDEQGNFKYGSHNPDPFPEFWSIRMPTWTNPHVKLKAIRDAKKIMPEDAFRQEFGARFVGDTARVFKNVPNCIRGNGLEHNIYGHRYVIGVDLAKHIDYTVITVVDTVRKHVVYTERFNQIPWEMQYARIIEAYRRFDNALICMDSTGLGDPIVETLTNAGLRIEPYRISGSTAKQQLIDKLRIAIEQGSVSFPHTAETLPLIDELGSFEYTFTKNGNVKYSAPYGKHDDTVISLALAVWIADTEPWVYRAWNQPGI